MNKNTFHLQVIKEALSKRQKQNPSYSLRAYGRDLNMDPATLSAVLKGKRSFPIKNCDSVVQSLKLTPLERMRFIESAMMKRALLDQIKINSNEQYLLDESHYRIVAEWEHYAVLTYADLMNAQISPDSISKKFGVGKLRSEVVIQNLLNAQLLSQNQDGTYSKVHTSVRTTEDISSAAIRASHLETLEMGKVKLEAIDIADRDYSSIHLAIDPAQMTELKTLIREFRKKVSALAQSGESKREVYKLAIQFYPLTQLEKQEKSI